MHIGGIILLFVMFLFLSAVIAAVFQLNKKNVTKIKIVKSKSKRSRQSLRKLMITGTDSRHIDSITEFTGE